MMRISKLLGALLIFGFASGSAFAVDVKINGDLNNRMMIYTDQAGMFRGAETISNPNISEEAVDETWAEIKYRLGFTAATDDGSAKAVYALELGAIRFGDSTRGGGYSGDGNNYETRFAYLDAAIPGAAKHRLTIGLQPLTVNKFLWSETAMGLAFTGTGGPLKYTVGWFRGAEQFNSTPEQPLFRDADNLVVRGDFSPSKDMNVGVFGVWQHAHPGFTPTATSAAVVSYELKRWSGVDYNIFDIGVDGGAKFGPAFVNWDAIYQVGSATAPVFGAAATDLDVSAFFAHADLGYNFGPAKITYTGWYASGDDDAADGDIENFMSTDVDTFDSIIFFEGGYTDDNYFTEAPYFLTNGAIFNKLALDFKANEKTTLSLAGIYAMTAQDLVLANGEETKNLGIEIDGAITYQASKNLQFAINAGYLIADDGMDFFEPTALQDGQSDSDIFRSTARVRYTF